jgi:hypothetical protein
MKRVTIGTTFVTGLCLALSTILAAPVAAQQRTGVYIGEIKGPDGFVAERIRLLFMEEFSKIKALDLVDAKEKAQLVLDGIAKAEAGEEGTLLSVKLLEQASGRIVFAGNRTEPGSSNRATRNAVLFMVRDIKRALKWQ